MKSPDIIAREQLQFALDNQDDCFGKKHAELYGVTKQEQFVRIASAEDLYQLLEASYNCENYIGLSIHATGWVAPLNEDGEVDVRPSEHPERRRVAVITLATAQGLGSALAFPDETEIVTDEGQAEGALAEALLSCWQRSVVAP
jgi:hypothetical protein